MKCVTCNKCDIESVWRSLYCWRLPAGMHHAAMSASKQFVNQHGRVYASHIMGGHTLRPAPIARPSHAVRACQPVWSRTRVACNAAVGIDLGTTSSAIALVDESSGRPYILADEHGKAIVPSVVAYHEDGTVSVGREAQDLASCAGAMTSRSGTEQSKAESTGSLQSDQFYYSTKRLMGRMLPEVAELAGRLSYPVVQHPQGWAAFQRPAGPPVPAGSAGSPNQGSSEVMLPQEVAAHILRHLLERAESHLRKQQQKTAQQSPQPSPDTRQPTGSNNGNGSTHATGSHLLYPPLDMVTEAVITVPAHFSAAARAATIEAGRMAGLDKVQLMQEPIAAALAYGYGVGGPCSSSYDTLLVFDLGGGTLDVSLLEGWDGIMEVLMTEGDDELGGDDLTRGLAELLLSKAGCRPLRDLTPAQRLAITRCAELAKVQLSNHAASTQNTAQPITVPLPHALASSQQTVQLTIAEVETAWAPLLQQLWPPLQRLAADSCLQFNGRLPDVVAQQGHNSTARSAPDSHAAGTGKQDTSYTAAQRANAEQAQRERGKVLAQHQMFASDPSLGAADKPKYGAPPRKLTGVVLVGAATRTPAVRQFVSQMCNMDVAKGADPEEVVALGAALQAGVLSGKVGRGAELTDGGYIASEHGRYTGWSSDMEVEWQP